MQKECLLGCIMKKSFTLLCVSLIILGCSLFSNEANATNKTIEVSNFDKCKLSVKQYKERYRSILYTIESNKKSNLGICDYNLNYSNIKNSCLKSATDENNPIAQYYLGLIYTSQDCSTPPNFLEAEKWLTLSANQNFSQAQSLLGWLYSSDRGEGKNFVKQNKNKSVELYKKAAAQNDLWSIRVLALEYKEKGELSKAVKLYKQGYKLGDAESAWLLGDLYFENKKLNKGVQESLKWFENAAKLKQDIAHSVSVGKIYELGLYSQNVYENGNYVKTLSKSFKPNKEKALYYYKLACDTRKILGDEDEFSLIPKTYTGESYSKEGCKLYNKLNKY